MNIKTDKNYQQAHILLTNHEKQDIFITVFQNGVMNIPCFIITNHKNAAEV